MSVRVRLEKPAMRLEDRTESVVRKKPVSISNPLLAHLREIVKLLSQRKQPMDQQGNLLLNLDLEGIRCTFVRCEKKTEIQDLSPREQEIARMVAKGYPNKAIAAVLEISAWTVSTHLRRIFAKLGVGSRAAMVAKIIEERYSVAGSADIQEKRMAG